MISITLKIWSLINIIFFIGLGIVVLIKHQGIASHLNYEFSTNTGLIEFKATYGGLMLALGVSLAYLLYKEQYTLLALFITVLYFGFGLGRLISAISHQGWNTQVLTYLATEILGGLLSLWLWWKLTH